MKFCLFIMMFFTVACSNSEWIVESTGFRLPAAAESSQYAIQDKEFFRKNLQEKLHRFHVYQVIGQNSVLTQVEDGQNYFLQASELNGREIEAELAGIYQELSSNHKGSFAARLKIFRSEIAAFGSKSPLSAQSMEKLASRWGASSIPIPLLGSNQINSEYQKLATTPDFQIYYTNIQHLAHLLKIKADKALSKNLKQQLLTNNTLNCRVKACPQKY